MPILKKPLGKGKEEVKSVETDAYIDLGALYFQDESSISAGGIKIAEIYRYEDVGPITQPVYQGNILMIDYTPIANDQNTLKRITNELKSVARDTNGDVAAIGNNFIVVAPNGIRIDRKKIKGGYQ